MKKRFFIIDGSALAYRSYFAFIKNPLRDSKGENTSAVFGFTSFLLKILKEENPPYITVCFDTPTPTFRHKMYSAYKATREKIPPDMKSQIPVIREVTEALGIKPGPELGLLMKRLHAMLIDGELSLDSDFGEVAKRMWIGNE